MKSHKILEFPAKINQDLTGGGNVHAPTACINAGNYSGERCTCEVAEMIYFNSDIGDTNITTIRNYLL